MSPRMADTDDTEENIPLQAFNQVRMIRVTPETVVFDNVLIHTAYQERITLVNTLTAPVELVSIKFRATFSHSNVQILIDWRSNRATSGSQPRSPA